MICSISPSQPM